MMSEKEKIYLIQCLLYDIRLNWSTCVKRRAELAKKLCLEIGSDDFLTLAKECDTFLSDYNHISKSDVITDIVKWNTDVASYKYWTESPWTNWFHVQEIADNLKYIPLD